MLSRLETIKTILVSADKGFRMRAVNILNSSGFPAEKIYVETLKEISRKFQVDQKIGNIVVDGSDSLGKKFLEDKKHLQDLAKIRPFKCLGYATSEQEMIAYREYFSDMPFVFISQPPLANRDFVNTFHMSRKKKPVKLNNRNNRSQAAAKPKPKKAWGAIEASAHVKETIDYINKLVANPTEIEVLATVGQRFNGLIGALSFYGEKPGYRELRHLSIIIDDISKSYESSPEDAVSKEHVDFLVNTAKCSYRILQELREDRSITPDLLMDYQAISQKYDSDATIKKREENDQDAVDDLLNKMAG